MVCLLYATVCISERGKFLRGFFVVVLALLAACSFLLPSHARAQGHIPLYCSGYDSCDGLYADQQGCDTIFSDVQDDQVYVNGHHAGVEHLYYDETCHTMHMGFRADNNFCVWSPGAGMGQYNSVEVNVAPEPNKSPICGAWWNSGMDEKEYYDGEGTCEDFIVSGSTGLGPLFHKGIYGGAGC